MKGPFLLASVIAYATLGQNEFILDPNEAMLQSTQLTIGGMCLPDHAHISLGPRHPTSAGLIRLVVKLDATTITSAEVSAGYGHRAVEKLFEVRDYRSAIILADRHDWWSAFSGELLLALATEEAMHLSPAPRSIVLRTLLAEYFRMHSHLGFLSYLATGTEAQFLWDCVDRLRNGVLEWSGNRVHPMLVRLGGLATDVAENWWSGLDSLLMDIARLADTLRTRLAATQRFSGLATVDRETCLAYGLSGPVSRACGLDLDRRSSGYLAYGCLLQSIPLRTRGDAQARFEVLLDEVDASIAMIRAARSLAHETPGEVSIRLTHRLKVPEGQHSAELEAPWGMASCLIVSRGGKSPWRVALRTPSQANLSALGQALIGIPRDSIADAVASIGYTVGDADK